MFQHNAHFSYFFHYFQKHFSILNLFFSLLKFFIYFSKKFPFVKRIFFHQRIFFFSKKKHLKIILFFFHFSFFSNVNLSAKTTLELQCIREYYQKFRHILLCNIFHAQHYQIYFSSSSSFKLPYSHPIPPTLATIFILLLLNFFF